MMQEMMKQCCGAEGKPDFEKMKQFMEHCGKQDFSDDHIAMMKQFCDQQGLPDKAKMMQMMESCGCHIPESAQ